MRSEGYNSRSVCLSVRNYSRTTGYEAAYERYQQLQCYKSKKTNVAISLKRLRLRDMAENKLKINMHNERMRVHMYRMRIANALRRGLALH